MQLDPDRLASMVSAIGTPRFGPALLGLFDDHGIVHGVGYELDGAQAPRFLFACAREARENEETAELVRRWSAADYRIDPVLHTLQTRARQHPEAAPTTVYCDAREVARSPSQAALVAHYYDRHALGEEVDYCLRDGERLTVLSLCRRRSAGWFNGTERNTLASVASLMLASLHQHRRLLSTLPAPALTREEQLRRVRTALLRDPGQLTAREADICAHIVMGYTAEGAGLQLGISPQTVASHRKRAYAKLGVTSQAELFGLWHRHAHTRPA